MSAIGPVVNITLVHHCDELGISSVRRPILFEDLCMVIPTVEEDARNAWSNTVRDEMRFADWISEAYWSGLAQGLDLSTLSKYLKRLYQ